MNSKEISKKAKEAVKLLKSLANDKRLMILCYIAESRLSVSELQNLIKISQPALSQHLAKLRNKKLISAEKEGQTIYYRIKNTDTLKVIKTLQSIYC